VTGTLVFWLPKRGTGVIRGEDGDYFAHITEFASTCKCGHMHKCEIAVGMRVEFTPSIDRATRRAKVPAGDWDLDCEGEGMNHEISRAKNATVNELAQLIQNTIEDFLVEEGPDAIPLH
jgi:cold shock CspA family protein